MNPTVSPLGAAAFALLSGLADVAVALLHPKPRRVRSRETTARAPTPPARRFCEPMRRFVHGRTFLQLFRVTSGDPKDGTPRRRHRSIGTSGIGSGASSLVTPSLAQRMQGG